MSLQNTICDFLAICHFSGLTRMVNYHRHTKVSFKEIVEWLIKVKFLGRSLYRAPETSVFNSRNARNVLNDARINWQRLVCLLAKALIKYLKPFVDHRRRFAFILDDTLFSHIFSTKTELLAWVFDHDKHCYLNGFRSLTLAWSDGNMLFPVNFALMSSKNKKQRIGAQAKTHDQRSIAGKRRYQAQQKMTDVAVALVHQALKVGVEAKYVLFDSWFSSPLMFWRLSKLGLTGIGMIKRSKKVYYQYRHRHETVKSLYDRLRHAHRRQRDHYLYSVIVQAHVETDQHTREFPLKLVYVTNRKHNGNYLVLATTDTSLTPDEIVQLYGRRWQIEGYFKVAKQYLRLDRSQIQNYDGLCGHLAMVMTSYDLLAWRQRQNEDERTLGDLFFTMNKALPDIAVAQAIIWLIEALAKLGRDLIDVSEKAINNVIDRFFTFFTQEPG
ncbi:transposase [Lacticaseibacillus casei]|nr:transposase [Lacticaseibacillus casei]